MINEDRIRKIELRLDALEKEKPAKAAAAPQREAGGNPGYGTREAAVMTKPEPVVAAEPAEDKAADVQRADYQYNPDQWRR